MLTTLAQKHCRAVALMTALLVGCEAEVPKQPTTERSNERPIVVAVNFPLYDFARRIAGDRVDLRLPASDSTTPTDWKPNADEIKQLRQADLVLTNGSGYSGWLQWVAISDSKVIDTTRGIRDRMIPIEDTVTHRHGPFGEQTSEALATHTWLNPRLAIEQAKAIESALSHLLPNHRSEFQRRLDQLTRDLEKLDDQLERVRTGSPRKWIGAARVFDYVADRCDLALRTVDWVTQQPTPDDMAAFEQVLGELPAKHVIWPSQPDARLSEYFESLGLRVIVFQTMENAPTSADYIKVMTQQIATLADL